MTTTSPYDIFDGIKGAFQDYCLAYMIAPRAFTWTTGNARVDVPPFFTLAISIYRNGSLAATMTIPAGQTSSSGLSAPVAVNTGDLIDIELTGSAGAQDLTYELYGTATMSSGSPLDLYDGIRGALGDGDMIYALAPCAFTWNAGAASVSVAPAGAMVLTIYKNGVSTATITIPAGQTSGTLSAPLTFAQNDVIDIELTGSAGASDLAYYLQGQINGIIPGLHRALIFNSHVPTVGVTKPSEQGVIELVWGAQDNSLNPPVNRAAVGVTHTYYLSWMRDETSSLAGASPGTTVTPAQATSWFRTNHPDWILYKNDYVSRAQYSTNTQPALDLSNSACLTWYYTTYIKAAMQNGFAGIAVDNSIAGNNMNAAGVYATVTGTVVSATGTSLVVSNAAGLAANQRIAFGSDATMEFKQIASSYAGGTTIPLTTAVAQTHVSGEWVGSWKMLYDPFNNGVSDDPLFTSTQQTCLTNLCAMLKGDYPTAIVILNQPFTGYSGWSLALSTGMDILQDEAGYTNWGDNNASPDIPYITTVNTLTGPLNYRHTANLWLDMTNAYVSMQRDRGIGLLINNGAPYQIVANITVNGNPTNDSAWGAVTAAQARFDCQWILANYFLVQYHATYLWWGNQGSNGGAGQYGQDTGAQPEFAACAAIGTPVGDFYASQGVYMRDFSNGRVIVNPDISATFTVTIPATTYKDLYGTTQGTSLSMGPHSGIVLIHL